MTIGASIFLIAVGAILTFAVEISSNAFNIETIGVILMLAGGAGLLLSLFLWSNNRSTVNPTTGQVDRAGTIDPESRRRS